METLKQWELPNNAKVRIEKDGELVTFLKMDGMYAKWDVGGEHFTGNFKSFRKVGDIYEVVTPKE